MIDKIGNIGIDSIYKNSVNKLLKSEETNGANDTFKSIFNAAIKMVENTDALQKEADSATIDFIVGENDNIHSVLVAQEKALLALEFTTNIANKSIEAYKEIMRMQI